MMPLTRKILTLPGIDHSGKELYETPNVEELPTTITHESFANPDIEVTRFDRKAALAQFITKVSLLRAYVVLLFFLRQCPQVFEAYGEAPDSESIESSRVAKVQVSLTELTTELNGLFGKVFGEGIFTH